MNIMERAALARVTHTETSKERRQISEETSQILIRLRDARIAMANMFFLISRK